jgi:hypothetical protein
MSYQQHPDMYHDPAARSPGSQRHQQPLHRQSSRQFDAYGAMPVNLYEDQMARYETSRLERLNPSLQQNNSSYAYDLSGSQTWNPNGFANAQSLGGIRSASASLKPNARGRTALPTVRTNWRVACCVVVFLPPSPSPFFFSWGTRPQQKKKKPPHTPIHNVPFY